MQDEGSFEVRHRHFNEDVLDWMEVMERALSADHRARSPLCRAVKTEYVKIPVPENAPGIGSKPVYN